MSPQEYKRLMKSCRKFFLLLLKRVFAFKPCSIRFCIILHFIGMLTCTDDQLSAFDYQHLDATYTPNFYGSSKGVISLSHVASVFPE